MLKTNTTTCDDILRKREYVVPYLDQEPQSLQSVETFVLFAGGALLLVVVVRIILGIRGNLAQGRPSVFAFSKQFGSLQLDFSIRLGRPGQDERDERQGLHRKVSRLLFFNIRQDSESSKNRNLKKAGGNPFIDNLAMMEGKGPKLGPTMANLASIRRIL